MLDDRADEFVRFRQPDGGIRLPGWAKPVRLNPWMNSVAKMPADNLLREPHVLVKPSSNPKDDKPVANEIRSP